MACKHERRQRGQKFCPDCGEEVDNSVEVIEDAVERVLERHGLIKSKQGEADDSKKKKKPRSVLDKALGRGAEDES